MSATFRLASAIASALAFAADCCPATENAEPLSARLSLVRYDAPRGASDGYAPTRQQAVRKGGEVAVDWPDFTLNGQPLFRANAEENASLRVRSGAGAKSFFQADGDDVIAPGNHWLRAIEEPPGTHHINTADHTARGSAGRYELWTFPVRIEGEGSPVVKNVELKSAGAVIFNKPGPWRSLTLLLPANAPGQPYELTIDGRGPVQFNAGLQPVKLGDPREIVYPIEAVLGRGSASITVRNTGQMSDFPNPAEWAADVAALAHPPSAPPALARDATSIQRYLGVEVPRSPLLIYAAALPNGMSGGFFGQGTRGFAGTFESCADMLADVEFDAVFEHSNTLPAPDAADSFEKRGIALARRGIRLGLQYDNNANRPSLAHANLAIFAHTLPEWHAPLYRSLQLAAQRFAQMPNFIGFDIGSGEAGYVSAQPAAAPSPAPWGEAMIGFFGTPDPKVPRAASLGAVEMPFEQAVKTQAEFIRYAQRYETAFRQYGYFAEAVREVDPRLVFTTAAFGSAPMNGGRGGWPWASIPGLAIFEELATQQAFDANQFHAAKPLHNVVLTDILTSYFPNKKTWSLIDDFRLLYGREAFQRACALALTRGVSGIGTNFLPTGGDVAFQKEMHSWMRMYGGVYAATKTDATIGIFFSHHQALQRRVVSGDAKDDDPYSGSHEGKVNEALFLCHAAGWPTRIITFQEMTRGPLPESMSAILLVGLDRVDASWSWDAGLEPSFRAFIARGGRILADDESVCAVAATPTGMKVAAYVAQSNVDPTPLLFARNIANIAKLRAAMEGVPALVAHSENPRLWAIPTLCGTTQYVTAVNQDFAEGEDAGTMLLPADPRATRPERWKAKGNASLFVKPQTGTLDWNTARPIYDVRLHRKLTADEASRVDLTMDAFRWYALPAAVVVEPDATFSVGAGGFFEAKPVMNNGLELTGIPVQIKVRGSHDSATVFGATGQTVRLPINEQSESGDFEITITELLTLQHRTKTLHTEIPPAKPSLPSAVKLWNAKALGEFAKRRHVPLTIALTSEQGKDAAFGVQARALAAYYEKRGRRVTIGSAEPGGVLESLQPLKTPNVFPQWKTIASDLILFGTPVNNVLLLDQARAQIFPRDSAPPAEGRAQIVCTRSPFVGEYDALNILASDAGGVAEAVKVIVAEK